MDIFVRKAGKVRVGLDGLNVVLEYTTREKVNTDVMPWDAALEVARAIIVQARKAQEIVNSAQLINDQALLVRLGVPLGLSNNPDIKKEAHKEAQFNDDLRRYITGARVVGIPSGEILGTPGIIKHGGNHG